jgi:DnaJ family protein C protein 28
MPNIEDILRKAMEEGKFDNLRGKGKPLHLDNTNPHADPDWELAYGMIKDAGYSLPWIETIRGIEKDLEAARKDLNLAWQVYQEGFSRAGVTSFLLDEWERARQAFRTKLNALNQRIRDYNLDVPAVRFQRPALNIDQEIQKITAKKV